MSQHDDTHSRAVEQLAGNATANESVYSHIPGLSRLEDLDLLEAIVRQLREANQRSNRERFVQLRATLSQELHLLTFCMPERKDVSALITRYNGWVHPADLGLADELRFIRHAAGRLHA
ncbi:hypothetical protein AB3K78_01390 [Leucobacter sp. HNU]|uniref:hypothetical protein n=1 Tax=Leucobacter sp. HNU TaxID=3236805 RepID=UPI003A808073